MRTFIASLLGSGLVASPSFAATEIYFAVDGYVNVQRQIAINTGPENFPAKCSAEYLPSVCLWTENFELKLSGFGYLTGLSSDGEIFTFGGLNDAATAIVNGTARYIGNGAYQGLSLEYINDDPQPTILDPNFDPDRATVYATDIGSSTGFQVFQVFPAPVPEPSTWALLIIGFGAIGSTLRHRRAALSASDVGGEFAS